MTSAEAGVANWLQQAKTTRHYGTMTLVVCCHCGDCILNMLLLGSL